MRLLAGALVSKGAVVLCPGTDHRPLLLRRLASRPQLKRGPLGHSLGSLNRRRSAPSSMYGVQKSPGVLVFLLAAIASCSGKEKAMRNEGYLTSNDGSRLFYQVAGIGLDTVVVVHGGP